MRVTVRHSRQKPAVRGKSKLAVCWKLPHTYTHTMKTACQPPEIKWCGWLIKNVKSKISIAVYISGFLPGVSTWGINIGLKLDLLLWKSQPCARLLSPCFSEPRHAPNILILFYHFNLPSISSEVIFCYFLLLFEGISVYYMLAGGKDGDVYLIEVADCIKAAPRLITCIRYIFWRYTGVPV